MPVRETGLYYLRSRYYNPTWGRFLNADVFVATGQGLLGNNMFAYCLNNPVNCYDPSGGASIAYSLGDDSPLSFIDLFFGFGGGGGGGGGVGSLVGTLGTVALGAELISGIDDVPDLSYDEANVAYGAPPPNDDDDDDEDYFGGWQKIGKSKGKAPRSNQAQNKQFRDATKNLSKAQKRIIHDLITGKGLSFQEILKVIEETFIFVICWSSQEE